MNEQTQPTDAELLAEYDCVFNTTRTIDRHGVALRAVLAKWGTPAGAGEVVAWGIFDSQGFYEAASDQESAERFCAHYNKRKGADPLKPYTAKPLTTPQPTQAQAGAVPLATYRAYALIDSMGWALDDQEKDDMLRLLRATEAAHGITAHGVADMKGGQDVE